MGDDPIRPLPRASAEPKSQDPKLKDLSRQLAFRTGISAESRAAALLIAPKGSASLRGVSRVP